MEDDIDDSPDTPLITRPGRPKIIPVPKSNLCARVCMVFCAFAIVILSIIAYLLHINTPYIKINDDNPHTKPELVEGLIGAIVLYFLCFMASIVAWCRQCRSVAKPIEDARLSD
eukprot:gene38834-47230_t